MTTGTATYDVAAIRAAFPILERKIYGRPLVYLDNAATTHRPLPVLQAMHDFQIESNSNVHRGVHRLSVEATDRFEAARATVARFVGAADAKEIVFTRGTTEALNLCAATLARSRLGPGKAVLLTGMEHHSNIVPWQMACQSSGAELRVVPLLDDGSLDMAALDTLLDERVAVFAFVHVSNALGTVNPVADLVARAHAVGAVAVVDGAQAMGHARVDVAALGADLYAFSGHKLYGPMGIGGLYGRAEILATLPPWQGGGDMIRSVSFARTTYADPPARFEAGTPNVTGAIGMAAAMDWLDGVGREAVAAHEADLLDYGIERLRAVEGLVFIGRAPVRAGAISFILEGIHPHDLGTILDRDGIAVRAGHHCAQPVMDRFGVPATARASFAAYNRRDEIDALVAGLGRARELFG